MLRASGRAGGWRPSVMLGRDGAARRPRAVPVLICLAGPPSTGRETRLWALPGAGRSGQGPALAPRAAKDGTFSEVEERPRTLIHMGAVEVLGPGLRPAHPARDSRLDRQRPAKRLRLRRKFPRRGLISEQACTGWPCPLVGGGSVSSIPLLLRKLMRIRAKADRGRRA